MFDHGLNRDHLFAAARLVVDFTRSDGKPTTASGPGFVLNAEGVHYLVTNRHVVDPSYRDDERFLGASYESTTASIVTECVDHGEHIASFKVDAPFGYAATWDDVAACRITSGWRVSRCCVSGKLSSLPIDLVLTRAGFESESPSESLIPMDMLAIVGFPKLQGAQQERSIVLPGFVASDPRHPVTLDGTQGRELPGSRNVLYQGFSRSGASGSPVLAIQRGLFIAKAANTRSRPPKLVGVNGGRADGGTSNESAISYFVRSDAILEAVANCAEE